MASTITATLASITGEDQEPGSIDVALCNYGSRVPVVPGTAVFDSTTVQNIPANESGVVTFDVPGNNVIQPPGTYYVITVRDANGDIVQVNAYRFADGTDYDLSDTDPVDPNAPPPPLPPTNALDVIPWDDPVFDGSVFTAWQLTLLGDTIGSVFQNLVDGNLYTTILIQDSVGGHSFEWPANVLNAMPVDQDANSISIQTFVAISGSLYSIAAGTYYL
jgi:hypothetical protein